MKYFIFGYKYQRNMETREKFIFLTKGNRSSYSCFIHLSVPYSVQEIKLIFSSCFSFDVLGYDSSDPLYAYRERFKYEAEHYCTTSKTVLVIKKNDRYKVCCFRLFHASKGFLGRLHHISRVFFTKIFILKDIQ